MKGFTAAAAEAIFPCCRIRRFGFDVEALYVARRQGLRITEIAVDWADDPDTRVRLLRDTVGSFVELLQVPWNGLLGRYARRTGGSPAVLERTPAARPGP
jgi:dolichyl-phosphate beta-glucosyltransferase